MPLRTLLNYRNVDVTSDLNFRLRDLIGKGVFLGGQVLPVAGTLNVTVPTLGAMGADGMVTLLEGAAETLTMTSGVTQWVLLHSYYVANAAPVAEFEVLTTAAYDGLSAEQQSRRVKIAKVTLAAAVTEVTTADISFTEAEHIDTLGRSAFRGTAPTVPDLPDYTDPATGVTQSNRPHDFYFVESERLFYSWSEAGTPSWQPVVSTAQELALAEHKQNQDDGATPPDFYEAQHVDLKHRESLDVGPASVKLHGSEGTDFGTGNTFVDEAFPGTETTRVDVTALSGVIEVQLLGTYYVGTGAFGSATPYFTVTDYQSTQVLIGTDRGPIRVQSVFRSDGAAELEPLADADALGYYDNPIIKLDFGETADGAYTGNLSVYASVKVTAGTKQPGVGTVGDVGVGFIPPAKDVPVIGSAFVEISTATAEVQQALEALDGAISAVTGGASGTVKKIVDLVSLAGGPDPDELNWYAGLGSASGTLTVYGTDPVIETATGLDLQFRVPSASEEFRWYFNTALELELTATALLPGTTLGLNLGATGTRFNEAWVESGRFGNVNTGGTTAGATGDGIFTNGLVVGYDAAPATDQIRVGDTSFRLWFNGTDPLIYFDTASGNDYLSYDRSANAWGFVVDSGTEALIGTDGVRIANGLYVGSVGTTATNDEIRADGDIHVGGRQLYFGVGSNDYIEHNETSNTFTFVNDGSTEYEFGASGADFKSNPILTSGGLSCGAIACGAINAGSSAIITTGGISGGLISCTQLNAGAGLISTSTNITAGGTMTCDQLYLDGVAEGRITYSASLNRMSFYVGNQEAGFYDDDGLNVLKGLRVGDSVTPVDNDIYAVGDVYCGGRIGRDVDNSIDWSAGTMLFKTGGGSEMTLQADGLRVASGLYVGNTITPATDDDITADGSIYAAVNIGQDSNNCLDWTSGLSFNVGGTAEMLLQADGLRVLNGLHVGGTGVAAVDNNIRAEGDITADNNLHGDQLTLRTNYTSAPGSLEEGRFYLRRNHPWLVSDSSVNANGTPVVHNTLFHTTDITLTSSGASEDIATVAMIPANTTETGTCFRCTLVGNYADIQTSGSKLVKVYWNNSATDLEIMTKGVTPGITSPAEGWVITIYGCIRASTVNIVATHLGDAEAVEVETRATTVPHTQTTNSLIKVSFTNDNAGSMDMIIGFATMEML